MSPEEPEVVEWDALSEADKQKAQKLMSELNLIMDKYIITPEPKSSDEACEDSILDD
jgi:hypothetical protein